MEEETEEAIALVKENLQTIENNNSTDVEKAVALEQLNYNAEVAFKSYADNHRWMKQYEY